MSSNGGTLSYASIDHRFPARFRDQATKSDWNNLPYEVTNNELPVDSTEDVFYSIVNKATKTKVIEPFRGDSPTPPPVPPPCGDKDVGTVKASSSNGYMNANETRKCSIGGSTIYHEPTTGSSIAGPSGNRSNGNTGYYSADTLYEATFNWQIKDDVSTSNDDGYSSCVDRNGSAVRGSSTSSVAGTVGKSSKISSPVNSNGGSSTSVAGTVGKYSKNSSQVNSNGGSSNSVAGTVGKSNKNSSQVNSKDGSTISVAGTVGKSSKNSSKGNSKDGSTTSVAGTVGKSNTTSSYLCLSEATSVKPVQYTVHAMGMLPLSEEDLSSSRSNQTVQRCMTLLTSASSKVDDAVYEWPKNLDLTLTIEDNTLKLINVKKKTVVLSHPLRAIRVWGVLPDPKSKYFSYVVRDDQTRYVCRVFKCGVPGSQVAGALKESCLRRIKEKQDIAAAAASDLRLL